MLIQTQKRILNTIFLGCGTKFSSQVAQIQAKQELKKETHVLEGIADEFDRLTQELLGYSASTIQQNADKFTKCGTAEKAYFGMFRIVPAKKKKAQPARKPEKKVALYSKGSLGYSLHGDAPIFATKADCLRYLSKQGFTHAHETSNFMGKVAVIPKKYRTN